MGMTEFQYTNMQMQNPNGIMSNVGNDEEISRLKKELVEEQQRHEQVVTGKPNSFVTGIHKTMRSLHQMHREQMHPSSSNKPKIADIGSVGSAGIKHNYGSHTGSAKKLIPKGLRGRDISGRRINREES